MKTFKMLLENAFRRVYRPVVIPLILLLVITILSAYFYIQEKEQENLILNMKDYSRQLNDVFLDIELKYNTVIRDLFTKEYLLHEQAGDFTQAFSSAFFEELKTSIKAIEFETLQIDEINYYRVSQEGVVYDTDFPLDRGLDLSQHEYFWKPFEDTSTGDIILKNLDNETLTGDIRLYSYIKLPDGSFFETGIRFNGMTEYIETKGKNTFGSLFSNLTIFKEGTNPVKVGVEMTDVHRQYLNQSETENKPILNFTGLFKGTLYYSQRSRYGLYRFVLDVNYYNNLMVIIALLLLGVLLFFHCKRMNSYLKELSASFAKPITTLENKMKTFNLSSQEENENKSESDVVEIQSMSKSFYTMCKNARDSYEEIEIMNEELEDSYLENQSLIDKMEVFLDIPQSLFSYNDMSELLSFCYKKLVNIINKTDCSLVSILRNQKLVFINGEGVDLKEINKLNLDSQKYLTKKKLLYKVFEEGEFMKEMDLHITDPKIQSLIASVNQALIIPAVTKAGYYGHVAFYNFKGSNNRLNFDDYRIAEFFSGFLKAFLMIKEFSELEINIQKETIHSIITLLEKHDPYTKGHSENVARLSREFSSYLGLSEKRVQDIYWAGIVHDMGKILLPQNILNKPTKLTMKEFEEIKRHPVYAYEVFKKSRSMKEIAKFIKHHHEKYNGKGYPDGLKGKDIPYESRIISIADAWDAMTSERVYKPGLSRSEAISEIMQNKGEQFDPQLAEKWLRFITKSKD